MASTQYEWVLADDCGPTGNEVYPQVVQAAPGSAIPTMRGLAFDAAATEAVQAALAMSLYGSGNLTVKVYWYADTATSGDVVWGASIQAVTPGDAQDLEADAWATENTATGTANGTGQGPVVTTITVSNLDSVAAHDLVNLRIRRIGGNGSDTMSGDAILLRVEVSYSDT
jgi:hypothetical protein